MQQQMHLLKVLQLLSESVAQSMAVVHSAHGKTQAWPQTVGSEAAEKYGYGALSLDEGVRGVGFRGFLWRWCFFRQRVE